MHILKRPSMSAGPVALAFLLLLGLRPWGLAQELDPSLPSVRALIEAYQEDRAALGRFFPWKMSKQGSKRLLALIDTFSARLHELDFDQLNQEERIDYCLLENQLRFEQRAQHQEQERLEAIEPWLGFGDSIMALAEARQRVDPIDPPALADQLHALAEAIATQQKRLSEPERLPPSPVLAVRLAETIDLHARALREWFEFYQGYHPSFSWWARLPHEKVMQALEAYAKWVRKEHAGFIEGEDPPVIGDPIGREALLEALDHEMIDYTPEELLAIAKKEFEWCDRERKKAADEMGFGEDWRAAYDHVKSKYVAPGQQPQLIKQLAQEAIDFLETRSLLTIPPLAKEIWRMRMMSPERQKVNPYFTGGEVISVSFPTDGMAHEDKLMSLRGNNIHFSRATVHHELIPGHHLQLFMAERYRTHRKLFRTPFLVEGWALYWEMLLWDLNFQGSPEDRIGMLFWRSHRCARILFSLGFHLGTMSAQEAIEFLVREVGHEPRNATAEVRRSVQGGYSPLYQAAYMLGGLQLRALSRELVDSGKMTHRAFHDAILKENAIPVAMIRASLKASELRPDHRDKWHFYPEQDLETGSRSEARVEPVSEAKINAPSAELEPRRILEGMLSNDRVEAQWFDDGNQFWYKRNLGDGRIEFRHVHAGEGTQQAALDHALLAACLSTFTGIEVDPYRLPIKALELHPTAPVMRLIGEDHDWLWMPDMGRLTRVARREQGANSAGQAQEEEVKSRRPRSNRSASQAGLSPDGQWRLVVRDHNLWVEGVGSKDRQALSFDGNPGASFQPNAMRDRLVGMRYDQEDPPEGIPEVFWSPDSQWVVALCHQPGAEREVYMVESSPRDQLQPKLHSYPYLKPGDSLPMSKPRLFHLPTRREIPLDDHLFANPWSISRFRWDASSDRFTFLYNQRGHQVLRLLAVTVEDGSVRPLIEETSPTFIDYAYKFHCTFLDASKEILWMSERDGWNHLYLHDALTGEVKQQVTHGPWVVRRVDRVDAELGQIWLEASGLDPEQDPYYVHHCRVDLNGGSMVRLTTDEGHHEVTYSPDRRFLIDRWSRVDHAPVMALRDAQQGQWIMELERSDLHALEASGWQRPERFVTKGRDGMTDIYGVIFRPTEFDPKKTYPVIEKIYAGPHGSFVPKAFGVRHSAQTMADNGFVVVQIDGMGTSNRSKAFHDVCFQNIGDAGFPDRKIWIQQASRSRPFMDLNRVGIYGGSAGGQNTLRGLLAHGDFYKVGVADCGCHDNRMDKIWWNELWMGWPPGPHYAEQSNVTQAHRLEGKLLLMVGELDRNVDPASTMQVVDALIKADKPFDMLVLPGVGHGAAGTPYGRKRMIAFFKEHLLEEDIW